VAVKRLAGGWCAGSVAPPVVLAAATAKPRRSSASRWNSVVFAGGSCSHRAPSPVVSCSHEDPGNPQCLGLTFPTDPKMLWPTGHPRYPCPGAKSTAGGRCFVTPVRCGGGAPQGGGLGGSWVTESVAMLGSGALPGGSGHGRDAVRGASHRGHGRSHKCP